MVRALLKGVCGVYVVPRALAAHNSIRACANLRIDNSDGEVLELGTTGDMHVVPWDDSI